MESFDTFSDDALASLFGLEVSLSLHQYRLKAASTFLRLRQRLEINAVKLQTLELRDFHKSTKKALFRNSMKNAADEKIESHILLPLIKDGASLRKQSLERLILVCYALQPADYKAIVDSGLKNVFTRLMRGIVIHISIRQDILDVLSAIIRDVWTGKDNSASILGMARENAASWILINRQMFSKTMDKAMIPTVSSQILFQVSTAVLNLSTRRLCLVFSIH